MKNFSIQSGPRFGFTPKVVCLHVSDSCLSCPQRREKSIWLEVFCVVDLRVAVSKYFISLTYSFLGQIVQCP